MRLGDVADLKNGYAFESSTYDWEGTYHVITIANVQDGYLSLSSTNTITELPSDLQKHHRLECSDILISMTGNVGRVCMVRAKKCLLNQRVGKLIPKGIDRLFLYYVVHSRHFLLSMIEMAVGGAQDNLGKPDISGYSCFIPRKSTEQRAITEALSDADGMLGALETLIAKKRAIKQAGMEQLLTGKTRLPGFSGEWATRRIGDLLTYERPDHYIVQSTDYLERGEVPVLTANKSFVLGYTDEDFGICHYLPAIVFDDFTTDCKYAMFPFKVKSSAIKLLRAKHERVSLRYVFERMQLVRFPVGDHKRYYISEYQNIALLVPDYDEQVEIVSALADMDAEVAALERRREKTRAIKQGMMQQLLTGRVRIVKAE